MSRLAESMKSKEQILTLFRSVIKFGVQENLGPHDMAGILLGIAESIKEQDKPLEWWLEHERGVN